MQNSVRSKFRLAHPLSLSIAVALFAAGTSSCGPQEKKWREYKEVDIAAPENPARTDVSMMMPEPAVAGQIPALQWTAPDGWIEEKMSGLRLATFHIDDAGQTGTCTVVMLGGEAGGLEANVVRWLGQLGQKPPPDDQFQDFLRRQASFTTAGGFSAVAVDLMEIVAAGDANSDSMIGAIIAVDGSTCFVKLTGPSSLLKREKEKYLNLCRSLQRQT